MIAAIASAAKKYPRSAFAFLLIVSWGSVAFSLWLTDAYTLHPCSYCIFQRLLYLLIGLVAAIGFLLPLIRRFWGGLIILISLVGTGMALHQSWMQFYPESSNCGFNANPNMIERFVDWLGTHWGWMFFADGVCSSKEFVFLGLSIANWSVFGFLFFAAAGFLLLRR